MFSEPAWFKNLPPEQKGWVTYTRNRPLAELTTIKVGGPAEVWAEFAGWEALCAWRQAVPEVPLTVLGKGSNMVIDDGGIPGVVTKLNAGFDAVRVEGQTVYAEAGAACGTVARAAREAGLAGLAFFGGIPGAIGGALRMNAGAYGGETYRELVRLWLVDKHGYVHEVEKDFVRPGYRHTQLPEGWIFRAGMWALQPGDKEEIRQQMRQINHARSSTQPLHLPSSGSWFRNPKQPPENGSNRMQPDATGRKIDANLMHAWQVVDAAGCRGMRVGGAMVSEQHANFFVNIGLAEGGTPATARDLKELDEKVRRQVKERLGIQIIREVKFVGVPAGV